MDKPSVKVLVFPIKRISSINSPPYAANKETNKETNEHTKKTGRIRTPSNSFELAMGNTNYLDVRYIPDI